MTFREEGKGNKLGSWGAETSNGSRCPPGLEGKGEEKVLQSHESGVGESSRPAEL